MKKFEFRLSSALRLYETKLDIEKGKLLHLLAEEQRILDLIAKRTEEVRLQNNSIREQIELHSSDLRALTFYNLNAQAQNIVLHEQLAQTGQAIQRQRVSVKREEQRVKLVSKLKARKFAEWQHSTDKEAESVSQEIWPSTHGLPRRQ